MSSMKDLFGDTPFPEPAPRRAFDGATYEPPRDHGRLKGQLLRVFDLMKDGHWRTLNGIADRVGGSPAAVSARLRDLRKAKYGSRVVERRYIGNGLFQYRVT
jgi:hypothetical protein